MRGDLIVTIIYYFLEKRSKANIAKRKKKRKKTTLIKSGGGWSMAMGYIVLFFMLFEIFHNILNFRNGESDSGRDHAHSKHFKKLDYERDGNITGS